MSMFSERVAVVTGGASGIGRALCMELAKRGAHVTVADINAKVAEAAADEIIKSGGRAKAASLDVTDAEAVKRLVNEIFSERGRLDYIFNNAGIGVFGEAYDFSMEDWRRVIETNLMGVFHGVAAAYPVMVKQGFGHIVNTSSLAGIVPMPLEVSYTASKYAIAGLSTTLRAEGMDLGVRVSVVCPGFIRTPIVEVNKVVGLDRDKVLAIFPEGLSAEKCARQILRGVEKNRAIIVITPLGKAMWWLYRLSPGLSMRIAELAGKRFREARLESGKRAAPEKKAEPSGKFQESIAIITGGASGIGKALSQELGRKGAKVTVSDIDLEGAEAVAEGIRKGGGSARAVRLDVSDAEAVKRLVDDTAAEFGRLDYMFNNAGISVACESYEKSLEDWRRVLRVNLMGVVHGTAACYPVMVRQGFGHIVNTGSLSSFSPLPFMISYAASKHGIFGISIALRAEAKDLGVKVSVTCPGFTATNIYRSSKYVNFDREKILSMLPKGDPPEKCAIEILLGVEKNRAIIVTTPLGKLVWHMSRLSQGFYIYMVAKLVVREAREQCREN